MLTIIGVAYSYLAPLISGVETESTISFNSGMIKITYQGSNVITGENIIPGWSETKEFTVVGSNNTSITQEDIMDYAIKLVVEENTFTDGAIRFELTGSSSNDADTLSPLFGKVPTGTGETLLGTARFNQDDNIKNDVTHTYSLRIGFPNDENKNQNEDMNKSFSAYIVVEQGTLQDNTMIASEYIEKVYTDSFNGMNILRYDETEDNNLRYFGSGTNVDDVPNYVSFNNELWRIIGVFDTYNADTGNTEKAVKIIRNNYLGSDSTLANVTSTYYTGYSWDTSDSSINAGNGVNAWNDADLMKELNGDYLDTSLTTNQLWYNGSANNKDALFQYKQRISDEYQQYIMNARWYLGGYNTYKVSATHGYTYEREITYKQIPGVTCTSATNCNDTVTRADYIDNLIGLAYPSDFGFAAKDNGSSNCSSNMYNSTNCSKTYNWMSKDKSEWTISHKVSSWFASHVFYWLSSGYLSSEFVLHRNGVRPVLYLSSDVIFTGGNGTSSNPYIIQL